MPPIFPPQFFLSALKTHAKFQNPRSTTSGRKVTGSEINKQERRRKKLKVATTFCLQHPRTVHALCSDQFLHVMAAILVIPLPTFNPKLILIQVFCRSSQYLAWLAILLIDDLRKLLLNWMKGIVYLIPPPLFYQLFGPSCLDIVSASHPLYWPVTKHLYKS